MSNTDAVDNMIILAAISDMTNLSGAERSALRRRVRGLSFTLDGETLIDDEHNTLDTHADIVRDHFRA